MEKEIRIFDTTNSVLKVGGIIFELFDVATGTLITNDTSKDLNPPPDEWGVKLKFSASSSGPFEIYTSDPTYRYPGNIIESLEGANTNRIDIDLSAVPTHSSGQGALSGGSSVMQILRWIDTAPKWEPDEKRAVRNLVLNYVKLAANSNRTPEKTALATVAQNWETAMRKLHIPYENLR